MIGKSIVWEKVEEFRRQYSCAELDTLPVDAHFVADVVVGLDMIPFDDLYSRYKVDAALTADFSGIYVDAEMHDLGPSAPMWKQKRARFSIAHELGHFVLHRAEFEESGFTDVESFVEWTESLGGRKYHIEQEANEFAGRLLVPCDRLAAKFEKLAAGFASVPNWRSLSELRRSAAELIAPKFGVSDLAMLVRFDREDLWPEPT